MHEEDLNSLMNGLMEDFSCYTNDTHYSSVTMDSIQALQGMTEMIKRTVDTKESGGSGPARKRPARPDVQQVQF